MEKKTIAVIGATDSQVAGVVDALAKEGTFNIRAISRHPKKYEGKAQEVVKGDLNDLDTTPLCSRLSTFRISLVGCIPKPKKTELQVGACPSILKRDVFT